MGGGDIGEILPKHYVGVEKLSGSIIAVDAYNMLYQFLSTIRQPDGTPLMDSNGRITSHLSGIIYRVTNLMACGILFIFVFDGSPPELKMKTLKRRKESREYARMQWEYLREISPELALKYAKASAYVDEEIVESAKKLLSYLGVPIIQSPSEGEAQAAFIAARGDAHHVASQDYDSLLFGAPSLIRNMSISHRHYTIISLHETLKTHNITRENLIDVAILIGTDYNDGIRGIGPKKALKLIKKYGCIEKIIAAKKIDTEGIEDYQIIREMFLHPDVYENYEIKWNPPDESKVLSFLCDEHEFSEARVRRALSRIVRERDDDDRSSRDSEKRRKKSSEQAKISDWL